jgi:group II intron reverse transcriptase/maturase
MPVLTSKQKKKPKQSKIRYTEYYNLQETFDRLYADSRNGKVFSHLMQLISSEENIHLAYRNIKRNSGSTTAGVDKRTMKDLAKYSEVAFVNLIKKKFSHYIPKPVRRVEIEKDNGKKRPLGIPTITDRIMQQCILQVLEPICEAKFFERSNGFRPNRSAEHAIAQCCRMMQVQNLHYVVDIDIKGFFDNVNHSKLIRQIWNMGIQDKKLICIIKAMLKAEIVMPDGKTIKPEKGTPQGGILSPLLSNIVLNELDWWIASQWENMPTHTPYKIRLNQQGTPIKSHVYRALRNSNLKEMYIVRYADDFKIFCRSYQDAVKAFEATKQWLKERLKLDISPEKSKIVNLKESYSDFLGFKIKVRPKSGKYVVNSHMCDKAFRKAQKKISDAIVAIQHPENEKKQYEAIQHYNSIVAGMHNYYCIATCVSIDFGKLAFLTSAKRDNRLREITSKGELSHGFIYEKYGRSKQLRFLNGHPLIPVGYVQTRNAQHKRKSVNKYTEEGRELIYKKLSLNTEVMIWLMNNRVHDKSIEYYDNRMSIYSAQRGKCAVTGDELLPYDIHCHHKKPRKNGGTDSYENLILVKEDVHILIHASVEATIQRYCNELKLTRKQMEKLNKLRLQVGNNEITM